MAMALLKDLSLKKEWFLFFFFFQVSLESYSRVFPLTDRRSSFLASLCYVCLTPWNFFGNDCAAPGGKEPSRFPIVARRHVNEQGQKEEKGTCVAGATENWLELSLFFFFFFIYYSQRNLLFWVNVVLWWHLGASWGRLGPSLVSPYLLYVLWGCPRVQESREKKKRRRRGKKLNGEKDKHSSHTCVLARGPPASSELRPSHTKTHEKGESVRFGVTVDGVLLPPPCIILPWPPVQSFFFLSIFFVAVVCKSNRTNMLVKLLDVCVSISPQKCKVLYNMEWRRSSLLCPIFRCFFFSPHSFVSWMNFYNGQSALIAGWMFVGI